MTKLLFIDDDANLRELYATEFSDEGYKVTTTSSDVDLSKLIQQCCPDIIILDIATANSHGARFLEALHSSYCAIPLILNSAFSTLKDDYRRWGAQAYVVKSGDLTELKKVIKDVLKSRRASRMEESPEWILSE